MKRNIFRAILSLTAMASVAMGQAQSQSGYFIDNYIYRNQLNPAFGYDKNFVSMPGIGNLNLGMSGTLNLDNVLYNVNGRTTTFLNPAISADRVLDGLKDNNRIGANMRIGIMSAGFKAWGGFNTVSINGVATINARVPKSLFSMMKEGIRNTTYDITGIDAHADAYAELAFGHSRNINKQWRVGGALKFLFGVANVDAEFERAQLTLGTDSWHAVTNAHIRSSMKGLTYELDYNDRTGHDYVDGVDVDGTGIGGFGMAVDLGAQFTLNKDWTFSASLLDFGFISWSNDMLASTNGDKKVETDKYIFNFDDDAPNSFDNEWDRLGDDLSQLYELDDMGDQGGRTRMLGATLNLAAEYTLPVYRKLKFGLLNSTRIQGKFSATEFRLSANVTPVKIFSAGVNMGLGTYGASFGWIANVSMTGFNFYLGMDHTLGKLAKQGVPLSSNAEVSMGINFPF